MTLSLSEVYKPGSVYAPLYPFSINPHHEFQNAALGGVPLTLNPVFSDPLLSIAGRDVDVVSFDSPHGRDTRNRLRECFGTPYAPESQLKLIPSMTSSCENCLDTHIVRHLQNSTRDRTLLVSQPFFDTGLESRYQIQPAVSHWLNDKCNLPKYVPAEFLPERYATFKNGEEFWEAGQMRIPCVAKIASSSSGDGVKIIRTKEDLEAARRIFRSWKYSIILEQYIDEGRNIGVQFCIPHSEEESPRVIGCARQIVSSEAAFIANDIEADFSISHRMQQAFTQTILPRVRALGWHGIGGMDVIDAGEKFYCIDPNFRYTAATPHLYHRINGHVSSPALSFFGTTRRKLSELERDARMGDPQQKFYVLAAHEGEGETQMIGAVLHHDDQTLLENIQALQSQGISSSAFDAQLLSSSLL